MINTLFLFIGLLVTELLAIPLVPSRAVASTSAPRSFNASLVRPNIKVPEPTTGCIEIAGAGGPDPSWTCYDTFPTIEQIYYWMDPVNGGTVTAEKVPLFYTHVHLDGHEQYTLRFLEYGRAYLGALQPPVISYDVSVAVKRGNRQW